MKKVFIIIGIIIAIPIVIELCGCLDYSNTNDDENVDGNDTNNTIPTIEEMIVGVWNREDSRIFNYAANSTLIIEDAASHYQYWFKDGYLFDTSKAESEPWIYKYNITFENKKTMTLTYLGYYLDEEWHSADPLKTYVFHRVNP